MKVLQPISFLCSIVFFVSCAGETRSDVNISDRATSSFELNPGNNDTVNRTDRSGHKQGPWIIMSKKYNSKHVFFPIDSGDYFDGKWLGLWKFYDSAGQVKNTVEYKDDILLKK